ncbi:MAG: BTAD domain-containing putative transcriptional regulator [Acidimicrobiales bacterium]
MRHLFRFGPPEPRRDILLRPRLLGALLDRWSHRVTSLVGGPGFGKTTLLLQAVDENRLAPRGEDFWIGIEPRDAEGDALARTVASVLTASDASEPPPAHDDPGAVADTVWRRAPTEICLIFDDVHLLPPGSPGAGWLTTLIDALPANGHVVLASRVEPSIPLARLQTHGVVRRITQGDLRFSNQELAWFAARRGIDPEHLADTGGWPAIAELAASVDRRLSEAYLWEEVLGPLGDERRRVLSVLCDLGRADDRLAAAALGRPVELATVFDGVPLVAEDADGWYCPHALWRSAPGLALAPDERASIRRGAVVHLRDRGLFEDAFALIEGAALWDEAPAVLRSACLTIEGLTSAQLDQWLAASPAEVRTSPIGTFAAALRTSFTAPSESLEPLRTAIERLQADGDVDAELIAITVLGRLAWMHQDLGPLGLDLAARVTELRATDHPRAQALASFVDAMVADFHGDDAGVVAALDAIEPRALDPVWDALAGWIAGLVRLDLGESDAALQLLARARPSSDAGIRAVTAGLRLRTLWAVGRVDQVLDEIPDVLDDVRASGGASIVHQGLTSASALYSHVGDVVRARQSLEEAGPGPAGPATRIGLAAAYLQLAEGDEERAAATVRAVLAYFDGDMGRGVYRHMWRLLLPLSYVLVPEARAPWDGMTLRGYLATARDLAAAVVAARQGDTDHLVGLPLSDLDRVRSALHYRFAAELAVALTSIGRSEGSDLLDALGPPGREAVRSIAAGESRSTKPARSLLATVPAPPRRPVELAVLGPMTLRRDGVAGGGGTSTDLRRTRLRALLAFLVTHRTTDRAAIMAALWPDLDERAASNNLGVTLNYVLNALEPERAAGEPAYLVRIDGQTVCLVTDAHLRIDTDTFDDHFAAAARAEAHGTPSMALEHDLAAVDLYRGELFADLSEADWMVLEREHYRTRFVSAATRAGQLLLARGDIEQAETVARQALATDPWAEEAYAVLVAAAVAYGDRSGANRLLDRCIAALADLGVEPSETTRQLRRRIQRAVVAAGG